MENFLYKCTICEMALFTSVDYGEIWCTDCGSCRSVQFHHKVVIRSGDNLPSDLLKSSPFSMSFYCKMDEEVADDSKKEKPSFKL
jgi:DNA-directed RNA polymerase subunit RPC12/RpoP